ncbi:MAG: DUF5996 family protein, partial [Bacteroidota bacterium]
MKTIIEGCNSAWPRLDFESWAETAETIHLWTQIIGKIRLRMMPWQNHSWHSTLYISARGFTTGSMPYKNGILEIEFDFQDHCLTISSTFQKDVKFSLNGLSVAEFYNRVLEELRNLGVKVSIHGRPNEIADNLPFAETHHHKTYDPKSAINFWQATVSVHNVFLKFRSDFIGKCSPVHLFWGAFDVAVTRFSGRNAPLHQGGMPNMPLDVMQEAYSKEVSSAGFWPGSRDFPEPIFYSYCYPTPEGFSS